MFITCSFGTVVMFKCYWRRISSFLPNYCWWLQTRILVTHGIGFLSKVDKIVVLKDGHVSEAGSFTQLMDHNGAFAEFLRNYLTQEIELDGASGNPSDLEGVYPPQTMVLVNRLTLLTLLVVAIADDAAYTAQPAEVATTWWPQAMCWSVHSTYVTSFPSVSRMRTWITYHCFLFGMKATSSQFDHKKVFF